MVFVDQATESITTLGLLAQLAFITFPGVQTVALLAGVFAFGVYVGRLYESRRRRGGYEEGGNEPRRTDATGMN